MRTVPAQKPPALGKHARLFSPADLVVPASAEPSVTAPPVSALTDELLALDLLNALPAPNVDLERPASKVLAAESRSVLGQINVVNRVKSDG